MNDNQTLLTTNQQKQRTYIFLLIMLCILPVLGYFSNCGFSLPSLKDLLWLPLNFGTYGIAGIFVVVTLIFIVGALYAFVSCIRSIGISLAGIIVGIFAAIIFFAIAVTLLVDVLLLGYNAVINWVNALMPQPVPGASEFLGTAVLNSIVYDTPFILFILKARKYRKLSCSEPSEPSL